MISVSNTTKDLLKKSSAISTSAGATFEYNLNSMVEYIKATSSALTNTYTNAFKKLFPIDTIYKPFRPLSPGIKYLVHTDNNTDTPLNSFERPRDVNMGTKPRLYYPGPDMVYKYWLAPKNTNIDISLEYFSDEAKTVAKLVPANKIIARFETSHDTPVSWVISVVKQDNSVLNVPGTFINPNNGEATIYYNGTTWLAMTSTTPPPTYTTTEYLKKISLTAVNSNTGKLIGVIEFSPRWVISVDSDIISFLINKETTSDNSSIVPVGLITANYLNISLMKPRTTSTAIVEYNRKSDIDNTKIYLFKNVMVNPYLNIGNGITSEKVIQGTFYINEWTLSEFGEATIDATDAAKILQDTLCPQLLIQGSPITAIIKRILDSVGFSNYKINVKKSAGIVSDDSIPSIAYWWSDGDKTVWDVLQELCRDIQMNAFVDEYNVLNFYSRNFIYDDTIEPQWTFTSEEIKTGSTVNYYPNIISLNSKEISSANQVRVRYSTAFVSTNQQSSSPLWKSSESFLGAGSLATDITDSSTMFQLNPNTINTARPDKVLDAFSGYVLINDEIIEYEGLWYQYVPASGGPALPVLIKNQSDIYKYSAISKSGYKNFYPTGQYNIKTRGALGTKKPEEDHLATLDSYINKPGESNANKFNLYNIKLATPDTAKLKPGVSKLTTPANTKSETVTKSYLAVSNLDMDKKTFDIALKSFNSIDTANNYAAYGTRMFFDSQVNSPEQVGGIGFCLDSTGKNGYYILIRTTAFAGLQKDIMIVRVKNDKLKVLKDSQQISTKTLSGIYSGSSYNIDVLLNRKVSGSIIKNTITLFINGFKITAVDSGDDSTNTYIPPIEITKNVGLHCGQGVAYFEYLYAKSIDDATYEKNRLTQSYQHNGVYSDDTLSMLYGDLIYNDGGTSPDQSGAVFEFGTTAREIKKTKIQYDDRPAIPIQFRTSLNKYATVLDQRLQPFGAESYVLNNTSTSVVLDDSNNTSFYVLGNSIQRSGVIDYDTDQSTDSENKESVIFDSSWIQSEEDAKLLAEWIKSNILNKGKFVEMQVFGNPTISAGDLVKINYPVLGMTESSNKYIVTRCTLDYREGLSTSISCRAI